MKAGILGKIASLKISILVYCYVCNCYVCNYVCNVYMYVYIYTYVYIYIYTHTHIPYCLSYLSKTVLKVIWYKMVLKYTHKKIITNFTDI